MYIDILFFRLNCARVRLANSRRKSRLLLKSGGRAEPCHLDREASPADVRRAGDDRRTSAKLSFPDFQPPRSLGLRTVSHTRRWLPGAEGRLPRTPHPVPFSNPSPFLLPRLRLWPQGLRVQRPMARRKALPWIHRRFCSHLGRLWRARQHSSPPCTSCPWTQRRARRADVP